MTAVDAGFVAAIAAWIAYEVGYRRGLARARDIIMPRLGSLRPVEPDHDAVQRALLRRRGE